MEHLQEQVDSFPKELEKRAAANEQLPRSDQGIL
jgi:hypothetical protein